MNRPPRPQLTWRATAVVLALLVSLLAAVIAVNSPIPVIAEQYGDTTLFFAADRAWSLYPGDCVAVEWSVEGIESLHIEERGEIGYGEKAFCPQINRISARFEVRTPDGLYREFWLRIHFLPDLLVYLAGFLGVASSLGLAVYFLWTNRLERSLNPRWVGVALVSLIALGISLRLSAPDRPSLEVDDGQVKVAMWAEKASLIFPKECLDISLSVVGQQSLRLNGEEVSLAGNWAQRKHCDAHGRAAVLEVVGADGIERQYALPIFAPFASLAHIPVFFYLSLFALLLAALVYLPMALEKTRGMIITRGGGSSRCLRFLYAYVVSAIWL
ncbi:MAG: hypothetical protein OXE95_12960 [Chloroflexi bacterium]|nr:hypothetical protein [Chloroflexota bacterium]MCY4248472.1 hypothetical protein [Chloroflexota bacterium]